jgi:hypothetical protein
MVDIAQFPVAHAHTPFGHYEVTFHNVTSGQKSPLGRALRNLRLRMRTPNGTPKGSLPVAMVLVLLYYILYLHNVPVAHVLAITSGSGQCLFRSRDFRSGMRNGQILWILLKYDFVASSLLLGCDTEKIKINKNVILCPLMAF